MPKLTKRHVESLTYHGRVEDGRANRYVSWDTEVKGFGCRVFPSGKKTFIVSYRSGATKRMMTLGDVGVLTADQARAMAREVLVKVAKGQDPLDERKQAAEVETFGDLCTAYLERHASQKKTADQDRRRIRFYLTSWAGRKVTSITKADVAALHRRIGKDAPHQANRVLSLLRKMFDLAGDKAWSMVPEGFNPARGIKRYREQPRDRWIRPEELPRLAEAIDRESNLYMRFGLWLLLLTGCRKSEILRAKWVDVDFTRAELRVQDDKAGRTRYVPLSAPALALLSEIPHDAGNPYVLPGTKPGTHLVAIIKAWYRVCEAAGLEDVRLHDVRRTAGSWMACSGASLPIIGKALGHTTASATQIYARLSEDAARAALEAYGWQIAAIASKAPTAEVVDIARRKA